MKYKLLYFILLIPFCFLGCSSLDNDFNELPEKKDNKLINNPPENDSNARLKVIEEKLNNILKTSLIKGNFDRKKNCLQIKKLETQIKYLQNSSGAKYCEVSSRVSTVINYFCKTSKWQRFPSSYPVNNLVLVNKISLNLIPPSKRKEKIFDSPCISLHQIDRISSSEEIALPINLNKELNRILLLNSEDLTIWLTEFDKELYNKYFPKYVDIAIKTQQWDHISYILDECSNKFIDITKNKSICEKTIQFVSRESENEKRN
jgi:hypothetical protein